MHLATTIRFCADRHFKTCTRILLSDMLSAKAKDWFLLAVGVLVLSPLCAGCPLPEDSPCLCEYNEENKYIINCRYKPLQEVPKFTNSSIRVYEVALYKCMIREIPPDAFAVLVHVERIDLNENPLVIFDDNAFRGIEDSLTELVLSANGLDAQVPFPEAALSRLRNLQLLHMNKFHIPSLPVRALSNLAALRDLSITNSGLESLSAEDFLNQRDSLQNLHLQSNELSKFPHSALRVLRKLQVLDLTQNGIRDAIPENAFVNNVDLEEIDLSNNMFHPIAEGAFNGITNTLKIFHMRSNLLTHFDLFKVGTLGAVEDLDLSYNGDLDALENQVLSNMHSLRKLNLHGCNIGRLTPESFTGVKDSLVILQLAANGLTSIQTGTFEGFTKLEDLYLDHMQSLGSILNENTLSGLESSLRELSLENSGFSSRNWPSVKNLAHLTKLKLRNNEIDSAPPEFALQKLTRLETLDLSFNMIDEITQRSMVGPQNSLTTVELGKNLLTTLSQCAYDGFTRLQHIGLKDNPLHCDCNLAWLRQWVDQNYNDDLKSILQWKCNTPAEHQDKYFVDVTVEELNQVCGGSTKDPQCEVFTTTTPTTTTRSTTTTTTTTERPRPTPDVTDRIPTTRPLIVNITELTTTTCDIRWFTERRGDIEHFEIDVTQRNPDTIISTGKVGMNVRDFRVEDLKPASDYKVCVTMWVTVGGFQDDEVGCVDFTTLKDPSSMATTANSMTTIIAVVCVVVAVLVILIVVFVIVLKCRGKLPHVLAKWSEKKTTAKSSSQPTVGKDSQRFSKHTSQEIHHQNQANKNLEHIKNYKHIDLERDLQRFTPEERERILNMLTHTGGSHLSTISMASMGSQRYVPEPPARRSGPSPAMGSAGSYDHLAQPGYYTMPVGAEGYLTPAEGYLEPQSLDGDEGYMEPHTYVEIDTEQPQISKECYI